MMENEQDVKTTDDETSASSESTDDKQQESAESHSQDGTSKEEENAEVTVDYAGELKKLGESRDRAQETARFEREKRKELERELKGKEEGDKKEDDIDTRINDRVNQALLEARQDIIDEELDGLTNDKVERELIMAIYTKRLNPAAYGYSRRGVKEALKVAKLAANLPRYEAQLVAKAKAEAKKEMAEEQGMKGSSGGSSTRRQPEDGENKNLNADERALLARAEQAEKNIQRRSV